MHASQVHCALVLQPELSAAHFVDLSAGCTMTDCAASPVDKLRCDLPACRRFGLFSTDLAGCSSIYACVRHIGQCRGFLEPAGVALHAVQHQNCHHLLKRGRWSSCAPAVSPAAPTVLFGRRLVSCCSVRLQLQTPAATAVCVKLAVEGGTVCALVCKLLSKCRSDEYGWPHRSAC
jgi:hypothetical protein